MDTHEDVDKHGGIDVDVGRNRKILFESCLTVRCQLHEFGAGNAIARLVFGNSDNYDILLKEAHTFISRLGGHGYEPSLEKR